MCTCVRVNLSALFGLGFVSQERAQISRVCVCVFNTVFGFVWALGVLCLGSCGICVRLCACVLCVGVFGVLYVDVFRFGRGLQSEKMTTKNMTEVCGQRHTC